MDYISLFPTLPPVSCAAEGLYDCWLVRVEGNPIFRESCTETTLLPVGPFQKQCFARKNRVKCLPHSSFSPFRSKTLNPKPLNPKP